MKFKPIVIGNLVVFPCAKARAAMKDDHQNPNLPTTTFKRLSGKQSGPSATPSAPTTRRRSCGRCGLIGRKAFQQIFTRRGVSNATDH